MELQKIKRLAATVLKTGERNVWMNPDETKRISEALTKEDVRQLITEKLIKKTKTQGHSRGKARILKAKKKKGRKRGYGKRRGTKKTRMDKKAQWISMVRGQRRYLRELREKKSISKEMYTRIYTLIKGGYFKGKRQIELFVKENK
ncbi:MAG: 50S ribosomal protein L19e [Candidatus Diapherotrites archaeon]|uniref:Large ribosomal subunit protein eL19 n=1 Tax=Candidatus Iainarchaeum sp. TaxID=3101447 RepID=A0A8T4LFP6_9ARCH|nr:50S ribosomal protein L19e [Candidatus Diapherotrites archaeon]